MNQIIIHVDMDAFYASVEMRDHPSLRGKPLIIGSMPNERGVVATCSYEARKYGIHSAMNIKEAYRRCPNGIYMRPDFDKYKAVSAQLHEIWNTYADASEYIALDEAYLDVTGKAKNFDGAREIAHTIKRRTHDELGLSCSVGVAYSKTAAKTASEEKKPDGYFEIPDEKAFMDLIARGKPPDSPVNDGSKAIVRKPRSAIVWAYRPEDCSLQAAICISDWRNPIRSAFSPVKYIRLKKCTPICGIISPAVTRNRLPKNWIKDCWTLPY